MDRPIDFQESARADLQREIARLDPARSREEGARFSLNERLIPLDDDDSGGSEFQIRFGAP